MSNQKPKQEKFQKGDPNKQFDVMVSIIHDDRKGTSRPVQKPVRISFETEAEAQAHFDKLTEAK